MRNYVVTVKGMIKRFLFHASVMTTYREYHHFPFNYNKPLPKDSWKTMALCCDVLEKLGMIYRITDGTILGLYRNGNFIPHDNDIDVDVLDFANNGLLHKKMLAIGMKLGRKVVYKKKIQQLVYYNDAEIVFDIVFWHSRGDLIYNYSEKGYERVQKKKYFENLLQIEYKGKKYFMPSHIEEWLEMRFGKDWKIPKTYKDDWKKECGDIKPINKV